MPRYSEKQKAALDTLMKEEVYRHAMSVITDEGLAALTMEQLASGVGVSRGTLYNYFEDRDDVIDYVEERTFTPLLQIMEEVAAGDLSPAEKLEAIAAKVFAAIYDNRALMVALIPEKYRGCKSDCQFERRMRGLGVLQKVVSEGVEDGTFRDVPPELAGEIFFGAISGLVETMAFRGKFRKPDKVVPTLMQIVVEGLRPRR